jgi:hypothetical protein
MLINIQAMLFIKILQNMNTRGRILILEMLQLPLFLEALVYIVEINLNTKNQV